VHCFIDHSRFAPADEATRRRVREELGSRPDEKLIACIGHVIPRKGQDIAVAAMPTILAQFPQSRLVCAGFLQQPYSASVKQLAFDLGIEDRVSFVGLRQDVPQIVASVDLCVQPSREEAQGLAALEATACGTPVVASRVGGLPECIIDGQSGLLVPREDPIALGEAVNRVLSDEQLRATVRSIGPAHVAANFSRQSQVDKVEQVLARFARRRKRRRAA